MGRCGAVLQEVLQGSEQSSICILTFGEGGGGSTQDSLGVCMDIWMSETMAGGQLVQTSIGHGCTGGQRLVQDQALEQSEQGGVEGEIGTAITGFELDAARFGRNARDPGQRWVAGDKIRGVSEKYQGGGTNARAYTGPN